MHRKQMNNDSDGETLVLFRAGVGEEPILSYIYACFQLGLAFQLARSFFPYGVDLSEACQLSRELTALIGLKKKPKLVFRTCKSWEWTIYVKKKKKKMVTHKMKLKASLKNSSHFFPKEHCHISVLWDWIRTSGVLTLSHNKPTVRGRSNSRSRARTLSAKKFTSGKYSFPMVIVTNCHKLGGLP